MSDEKHSVQVGFEDVFPDREWKLLDGEVGVRDAGVVDENVETVEFAAGSTEKRVDGVGIADVAGVSENLVFFGGEFPAGAG